jgi:hypothetical protein
MMGEGKFYRPGTRKGGKIWNFLGLGALLLLMVSVFFVGGLAVRNPGLIPARLSGKLQLWPKPALTPQKIVLHSNQPERYLGLLNISPNSLPEDQRKIERALYDGLVALGSASTPAYEAETKLGTELFTPLAAANTKEDLQPVRQVAEKLRSAGEKTLDDEKRAEKTLVGELKAAGLDEILAEKITALIAAKTRGGIDIATNNASRISNHTIQLIDFLEQNQADWHRESKQLIFNSAANSSRCNELMDQLKQDVEDLNKTVREAR